MNVALWSNPPFEIPCYICHKGAIRPIDNSAKYSETRESLINNEYHKNGLVNPDVVKLVSRHLICNNCDESLIMTYQETEDVRNVDEYGNEQSIYEHVRYFPTPPLIAIPNSCPKTIKIILDCSFSLFWIDLPSCANKIRVALEALMNELAVAETTDKLHNKIIKFADMQPSLANLIMSIKWIGNSGSHLDDVTKEAILDAYRLIEYVLEQIYNDRYEELTRLSVRINNAKKHE